LYYFCSFRDSPPPEHTHLHDSAPPHLIGIPHRPATIKDEIVPRFERLHLSNELANEFRGTAVHLLEQSRRNKNNGYLVLRTYAVENKPDPYEIEHLDLSAYDAILEQIDPLTSLAEIELFGEDEKFIASLRFYVITVEPPEGGPIHFYRS
jgi:hypothetical protein